MYMSAPKARKSMELLVYVENTRGALCISTFTSVRPYGVVRPSRHTFRLPIPAVVSQNVSNNSCLACVQSEIFILVHHQTPRVHKVR